MKKNLYCATLVGAIGYFSLVCGQDVLINSPTAWLTQRNDSVIVKAQIDTGAVKERSFSATLSIASAGKAKSIATKKFSVTDYTNDFSFGKINKTVVGGAEFLKIDWSIPKTSDKGTVAPFGIVDLNAVPKVEPLGSVHVKDGADLKTVSSTITDGQLKQIGAVSFASAWNKDAIFLVVKKGQDSGVVKFLIDGKNGKNAFLSYPDRIVNYSSASDSVWGTHYTRDFRSDSIIYTEQPWMTEISKEKIGDRTVIKVPTYDTGIMSFEGRKVGFAVFAYKAGDKQAGAIPEKASFFIPGTWTDLILEK